MQTLKSLIHLCACQFFASFFLIIFTGCSEESKPVIGGDNIDVGEGVPRKYFEIESLIEDFKADNNCNKSSFQTTGNYSSINCGVHNNYNFIIPIYIFPPEDPESPIKAMTVTILPIEYQWVLASDNEIGNDNITSTILTLSDLREELKNASWAQTQFRKATDIISVGVASQEGQENSENERAARRAKNLHREVAFLVSPNSSSQGFYIFNLGKYSQDRCRSKPSDTDYQRPVMIISVFGESKSRDQDLILKELKARLIKFDDINLDHTCYSIDNSILSLIQS